MSMRAGVVVIVALVASLSSARAAPQAPPLPRKIVAGSSSVIHLTGHAGGIVQIDGPGGRRSFHSGDATDLVIVGGGTLSIGALDGTRVHLSARRIVLEGAVHADALELSAGELIDIRAAATIDAAAVRLRARVVINAGRVSASNAGGGAIDIVADDVANQGALAATGARGDGGAVRVRYQRQLMESARGSVDVSGARRGGSISFAAGAGSHFFSSARHLARGQHGGDIAISGDAVQLVAATCDASGAEGGGDIRFGPATRTVSVDPGSRVAADGELAGSGGRIVLAAVDRTAVAGLISARGGARAGDGGFIEISGGGQLAWAGDGDLRAPAGRPGRLLLDPKNITIDRNATTLLSIELVNPISGTGNFGATALVLSTGNVVVTDPGADFGATNVGAVHLFSGRTGALLATLLGSTAGDAVGDRGAIALANGNFVASSSAWHNAQAASVGAWTWGSGTSGVAGTVSDRNSLVGATAGDASALGGLVPLANGNYVVAAVNWHNGAVANAGAVTWGNGNTGVTGVISAANSLVGSTNYDWIGVVTPLANGNYVVSSSLWTNGSIGNVGAVAWGDGSKGTSGVISPANSLVGSTASDQVGQLVTALPNGNYVVASPMWDRDGTRDAGAVTWGDGTTGVRGVVSGDNSLIGMYTNDQVGEGLRGVLPLASGNYVVSSSSWGGLLGAVTWARGDAPTTASVSQLNSLVGARPGDRTGVYVTALANGNYVVATPGWDGASADLGAVTWCDGKTGRIDVVSADNSLIGSTAGDSVGRAVTALTNGNYVVGSPFWDNGAVTDAGAATWADGATGLVGVVSAQNSLVGSSAGDIVNIASPLTNGNYVVQSPNWSNGTLKGAGAATWGDGTKGVVGTISAANSLVGSTAGDQVSYHPVVALPNGNYVVRSPYWGGGGIWHAGAATWGDGTKGVVGTISATNSLIGSTADDLIGNGIGALTNGNYLVSSAYWDNGSFVNAGAVTWGDGTRGVTGTISAANSLVNFGPATLGTVYVFPLLDGNYVILTGGAALATPDDGTAGMVGTISVPSTFQGASTVIGNKGPVEGTFLAGPSMTGGRVYVGIIDLYAIEPKYAWLPNQAVTITPFQIERVLARGIDLRLEASNDITVSSAVTAARAATTAGSLTLSAGRSISLNASVTTGDRGFTLIANDLLSNGVVDAQRDTGPGGISWGPGVAVDAGRGAVKLAVRKGTGKKNAQSGPLEVGTITAASLLAQADGAAITVEGTVMASAAGDAIILASDTGVSGPTGGTTPLSPAAGRFLIYAPSRATVTGTFPLSFEEFGKVYPEAPDPAHVGSGALYAINPDASVDAGGSDGGTADVRIDMQPADVATVDAMTGDATIIDVAAGDVATGDAGTNDGGGDVSADTGPGDAARDHTPADGGGSADARADAPGNGTGGGCACTTAPSTPSPLAAACLLAALIAAGLRRARPASRRAQRRGGRVIATLD